MLDHEPCAVLFSSVSELELRQQNGFRSIAMTYLAGDADLLRALRHLDWFEGCGT